MQSALKLGLAGNDGYERGATRVFVGITLTIFCSIDVAVAVGHILDACTQDVFGRGLQCAGQVGLTGVVGMAVHASAKICTRRDGSQRQC